MRLGLRALCPLHWQRYRHCEHVVQDEGESFGRTQGVEYDEHREPDGVCQRRFLRRIDGRRAITSMHRRVRFAGAKQVQGNARDNRRQPGCDVLDAATASRAGSNPGVDAGSKSAQKAGETTERLLAVSAWRESPHFDDAERAALAMAEAAIRLADRGDAVTDDIWDAAADHYDEAELAAIVLMIGATNMFNRLNATTRQIAGCAW
ncbi:carboxymuconolactone decarboxylase family protein [Antrihabitans spumae]|uniref:Carboxymuconolactone decarboxylase family protein n=1 Tax=Antrihabitans spumae TaxID=3373370 RepID=A0ABW7KXW8_9NOCA